MHASWLNVMAYSVTYTVGMMFFELRHFKSRVRFGRFRRDNSTSKSEIPPPQAFPYKTHLSELSELCRSVFPLNNSSLDETQIQNVGLTPITAASYERRVKGGNSGTQVIPAPPLN